MFALLDLLTPEDQERVDAHLATCESCLEWTDRARTALEGFERLEHIPASILARWDRLVPMMGPQERALMDRHLESCATCALALSAARERPARRTPSIRWVAGWTIAFATAAVLLFVLWPKFAGRDHGSQTAARPYSTRQPSAQEPPAPRPSSGAPALPERTEAGSVTLALAPAGTSASFDLRAQTRDTDEAPEIPAGGEVRTLSLRIPTIAWIDPTHTVRIQFFAPDDSALATLTVPLRVLSERPVLEVTAGRPWRAGAYRIEVRDLTPPEPGLEPESVSLLFQIR